MGIANTFEILPRPDGIINSVEFCDRVCCASFAFDEVLKAFLVCESDSPTMITAFASLLYIKVYVFQVKWLNSEERDKLQVVLRHRQAAF